jgi:nicotinic acid phosphoribosyltransferase
MRTYIETIEAAKRIHKHYLGSISHSFICQREDILDAFDMAFKAFPNDKVTIHYEKGNYWVVIEFNNGDSK